MAGKEGRQPECVSWVARRRRLLRLVPHTLTRRPRPYPPLQASDIAKEKAGDVVSKLRNEVLPDVSVERICRAVQQRPFTDVCRQHAARSEAAAQRG